MFMYNDSKNITHVRSLFYSQHYYLSTVYDVTSVSLYSVYDKLTIMIKKFHKYHM